MNEEGESRKSAEWKEVVWISNLLELTALQVKLTNVSYCLQSDSFMQWTKDRMCVNIGSSKENFMICWTKRTRAPILRQSKAV